MTKLRFEKNDYLNVGGQPLAGTFFVNWMKLLIENRFHIDWQFLPKAAYVTIMILITIPFRIYEKKKFDKKLEDVKIAPLLFIVGHWRSGTTFLHYLMGQDKGLAYVSTFETMTPGVFLGSEKMFEEIIKNHLPDKRPMDDLEMDADLPYEEEYAIANLSPYSFYHGWYFPNRIDHYFEQHVISNVNENGTIEKWKQVYCYFLKKISYKNNGKRIMLKSLVNTGKIKLILEMFPDAKFIHIYRNPYKVYLSTWKLYKKILPMFSFQHVKIEQLDNLIIKFYKKLYTKYVEEKKLIPRENIVEIKYEFFVKEPVKTLELVYKKLGLNGFEEAKSSLEKYVRKHKNYQADTYSLDKNTKEKIFKEWEFAFKEFGYKK
jgi:hypothetical protein